MSKIFLIILCLTLFCNAKTAGAGAAVILKSGKLLQTPTATADESGNLFIQLDGREQVVPRDDYKIVIAPLPAAASKAEKLIAGGDCRAAEKLLRQALKKYGFPGLEVRLKQLLASCLMGQKKYTEAEKLLAFLTEREIVWPEVQNKHYSQALLLLAAASRKTGKLEQECAALRKTAELAVPADAVPANNRLGEIFLQQGLEDRALRRFVLNIVLYPLNTAGIEQSLCETARLLKKRNNEKYKIYLEKLEKYYPDSKLIKK